MSDEFDSLVSIAIARVADTVGACGLMTEPSHEATSPANARWITASIGFSGEAARGAVTLVAATPFWRRYAQLAVAPTFLPEAMLADVAGELANMVLARVRNDLMRQGVDVHGATPTCAFGAEVTLRNPGQSLVAWNTWVTEAGDLYLRVDASLSAAFNLQQSDEAVEPCEAELTLF